LKTKEKISKALKGKPKAIQSVEKMKNSLIELWKNKSEDELNEWKQIVSQTSIERWKDIEYKTKVLKILELCKINELQCTFLESFNAYKHNVDVNLKNNFWMTPPNVKYSLSLDDLIYVSELFNSWLKSEVKKNKLNFCKVENNLEASNKYFYDDSHLNPNGSKKLSEIIFQCVKHNLK
jgi:hypothetical protein